jgi:hypothetical protein
MKSLLLTGFLGVASSWVLPRPISPIHIGLGRHQQQQRISNENSSRIQRTSLCSTSDNSLDIESLHEMDCFVYSRKNNNDASGKKLELGVLEEGVVQPICAWTTEEAFADFIEFVVDEEDRYSVRVQDVTIHSLVPEEFVSYGSRQVGGGKGPGNPHGEESELLYYIHNEFLKKTEAEGLEVIVKPELEITW